MTNPVMINYLYNFNSCPIGQSSMSTKSKAGFAGKSAAPYKYNTQVHCSLNHTDDHCSENNHNSNNSVIFSIPWLMDIHTRFAIYTIQMFLQIWFYVLMKYSQWCEAWISFCGAGPLANIPLEFFQDSQMYYWGQQWHPQWYKVWIGLLGMDSLHTIGNFFQWSQMHYWDQQCQSQGYSVWIGLLGL